MYVLLVQTGKYKGKRLKLPGTETLVGRDEAALVRIGSTDVSRRHCLLTPTSEGVKVTDLDSQNGTFINGVPVAPEAVLLPGGTLTVGPMTFQLQSTEPERKASPPKAAPPPARDESLSEDDIATLLAEGETGEQISMSDTTIITGRDATALGAAAPIEPPKKPKRQFASVAEEAADIIRRYREMVAAQEADQEQDA